MNGRILKEDAHEHRSDSQERQSTLDRIFTRKTTDKMSYTSRRK
jgi:hypothetical protein